ncbi:MAG TPA: hypothetical protein VGO07_05975, partial [Candidatus Saccharimonadales bacterium]|nr:hypothetical protein [Candidatus Saccharimonadales bacterium]
MMAEAFANSKAILLSAGEDMQGNRSAVAGLTAGAVAMGLYHFGGAETTYAYTLTYAYGAAKDFVNAVPDSVPFRQYMEYAVPAAAGVAMGTASWIVERVFTAGTVKAIQKFPKTSATYEQIKYENGDPPPPASGFFPRMWRGFRTAQFILGTGSPGIILRSKVHEPAEPIATHRAAGKRTSNQIFVVDSAIGAVVASGLLSGEKSGLAEVSATVIDYAQKPWLWAAILGGPPLLKAAGRLFKGA